MQERHVQIEQDRNTLSTVVSKTDIVHGVEQIHRLASNERSTFMLDMAINVI